MLASTTPLDRTLTLVQGTLGGTGTITTPIVSGAGVTVAPGDRTLATSARGTLTVENAVDLAGGTTDLRLFSGAAGSEALRMDNGGAGNATIAVASGNHTVASQVVATAASHLDVSTSGTGTTLHLTGGIDNAAGENVSLANGETGTLDIGDIVNAGTLSVAGPVEVGAVGGAGTTQVAAGASLTADSIVQDSLTIGTGGSVTIREVPVAAGGAAGANAVPEPSTWVLIGIGLLAFARRRRRRAT